MILEKKEQVRLAAIANFEFFVRLVHPQNVIGSIHSELMSWMSREDKKSHQIVLLPRDHRKSYYGILYAAWRITKDPTITILYISSTANLANKQLGTLKDILTSQVYRYYWPNMVNVEESKRSKWTESEIAVDHPLRKLEAIRDPTVFTAGMTTNIVGLHCNLAILDDFVTDENSSNEEGREKVLKKYSLLSSIETTSSEELILGTRYDPDDLYGVALSKTIQTYNSEGVLVKEEPLYEEFTREFESVGDGSGEYLWPRQQRKDGKWFGFDREIYEIKKAQYKGNERLFRAQYYNDPYGSEKAAISKECFQYYDRNFINKYQGQWYFKGEKLNIFAAIDFAFTTKDKSDYTAIVVVGVDRNLNYYILDIDRFKTDAVSVYFDHLLKLYQKWNFSTIRAEATAGQSVIVNTLKNDYIRKLGLSLSIKEFKPHLNKEIRTTTILEPKYTNRQIWHYLGGLCQTLEEELVVSKPSHDDIKDALASSIEGSIAPIAIFHKPINYQQYSHRQFGGIS